MPTRDGVKRLLFVRVLPLPRLRIETSLKPRLRWLAAKAHPLSQNAPPSSHDLKEPQRRESERVSTAKAAPLAASILPPRTQRAGPVLRRVFAGGLLLSTAAGLALSLRGSQPSSTMSLSSKLVPPNPADVMIIRELTPNVLICSVPFSRMGRFPIGGRATIVKLSAGGLAVFSPVALTPDLQAKLASWAPGQPVKYLVALDLEHHLFLSEWAAAHPGAKLVGPDGLPEKRLKAADSDPRVGREPFHAVFSDANARDLRVGPADFDRDFSCEFVGAHANRELVFCFRPDGVLIEADLLFNLPATEQYSRVPAAERPRLTGGLAGVFTSLQTTAGEAKAQKRFIWYLISARNRAGFTESVRRIAAWDFRTVVPCHGDVMEGDGKQVFEKIFEWFLEK